MILAAVGFGDPLMLAGLLAALVPVVLHLLNRMKAPVMAFPTLRFLKITAHKTARRRQIQQYFLLLVRVVVFALVAMAVAGPLIRGGSAVLAYGMVGLLLGGLGLLVVAAVWGTAAVRGGERETAKPGRNVAGAAGKSKAHGSRGGYGVLAMMAGIAAVGMLGLGAHGLVSDRYFSREAAGEFSGRSTAMVIVLDNSHSMLLKEDSITRLQRAKEEVRKLLGEAVRPAEAVILPTNLGTDGESAALTGDMTRLLGILDRLKPEGSARPMQERIRTGLEILGHSSQANKMLVIVSDFARPAFADAEVFGALKGLGWRKDLQVVLMPIQARGGVREGEQGEVPGDVGVAAFSLAEGSVRPVVGAEMTFEAQVVNNGDAAEVREFALTVDGVEVGAGDGGGRAGTGGSGSAALSTPPPVAVQRVQLGPAGSGTAKASVRIAYRLTQPGWHRFGLRMQNAQDAMAWDDQRELAIEVAEQVKVLVVGAEAGGGEGRPRVRSAAFYFEAALAPFGTGEGAGTGSGKGAVPWSIEPTYRGIDQLGDGAGLAGYAAIYLCDVPRVSPAAADALEAYVRGGGRVVWVLGPSVDGGAYNQVLLGQNRDLLPAALGEPLVTATASPVEWVDMHSGVFMSLFDNQEPFRSVLVTGRWSFAGNAREISGEGSKVLAKLADGVPLLTQHSVKGGTGTAGGEGRVYTLLTTPAAAWSNLGATVVLVPLASRMALGDFAGGAGDATTVEAGHSVSIHVAGLAGGQAGATATSLDVTTPEQAVINARALPVAGAAGAAGWQFDQTFGAGVYRWKTSDGRHEGMFVVNPPAEEVDLISADVGALAKEASPGVISGGRPTVVARGAKDLLQQLQQRGEGTSLAPGFLAMVLMLAVIEAMMANRYRPSGRN